MLVVTDSDNNPLVFNSKELRKRTIRQIELKLPSSVRAEGSIKVDVLVDRTGSVDCVRAREGHPLIKRAAEKAVKQWTFRPTRDRGESARFFGNPHVLFFNSGGESGLFL